MPTDRGNFHWQKMTLCDVVTGFLGSGKTTLLNAFLRLEAGADTAVIVNEFGAIGLDQMLYKEVSENVYLLDSGCLCCSVTHSLRETLLEILNVSAQMGRLPPERVVIETTGLADPLPILHSLVGDKALKNHFCLGQVITTVDAVQGRAQLARHKESMRQVLVADLLVITKCDMSSAQTRADLSLILAGVNPRASIVESVQGQGAALVFSSMGEEMPERFKTVGDYLPVATRGLLAGFKTGPSSLPDASVTSWSAFIEIQPTWPGIAAWWKLVSCHYGDRMLRCKGLLHLRGMKPFLLIQGVGKVFHNPNLLERWPDSDPRGRIVCIGVDLEPAWLQSSLRALEVTDASCLPSTLDELEHCF